MIKMSALKSFPHKFVELTKKRKKEEKKKRNILSFIVICLLRNEVKLSNEWGEAQSD